MDDFHLCEFHVHQKSDTSDTPINVLNENIVQEDFSLKPNVGMEFNSENDAYAFYMAYGGNVGFSVRKEYANKSSKDKTIITSRRFVCNKHGIRRKDKRDCDTINPRAETRTSCEARMGIIRLESGKYVCQDFVEQHNHPLHTPDTAHMMKSQRNLSTVQALEIDLADDSEIKPRAAFAHMSRQAGGRESLGYTHRDHRNYIRSKRSRDLMYGEAGSLLLYFQKQSRENPAFSYSMQLDSDEQLTNIFWADPKMIIDYAHFGDVVTFDTTYCTNKDARPLGVFVGFNHHRGIIIFGAALLYDETADSFKWLFENFLQVHGLKHPLTIFTDQDAAIAKALLEVFPQTWHGLCTWHIMQNAVKHLGNLMKDGSYFLKDFKKCIYEYVDELKFEQAWAKMRTDHFVENVKWLDNIYLLKAKWARCYMKNTLTLGIRSSQLSESMNGALKEYLKPSLDVVQFFKHFERVVRDNRYRELQAEFEARNKLPRIKYSRTPIVKQAANIYTPKIFDLFQQEYEWVGSCSIKFRNENDTVRKYVIGIDEEEGEFEVLFNPLESTIKCTCCKFETVGIICCHALKVLDVLDIKCLPCAYFLKRWSRSARSMIVQNRQGSVVMENPNLDSAERYRILCQRFVKLAALASDSIKGYNLATNFSTQLLTQLEQIHVEIPHPEMSAKDVSLLQQKRLKKKETRKGGKRIKSCLEGQKRKMPKNVNTPMLMV